MIGKTISHYKILEQIGSGGMGIVYKAEDLDLKRMVVLKFLPPDVTRDEESRKRFIHEAQSASALDHPNICTIYEVSRTDKGEIFISMGYYEGETLKDKISHGKLEAEQAIDLMHQIANGLLDAHEKGLVHRDIKPANIFITKDGVVKILDFGLAKSSRFTQLTKDGSTIGTVAYMSPEQSKGAQVDQRSDIWSLGVVMYEMITGELPFKGDYEQAIIYSILNENPQPITTNSDDLPPELTRIITKALSKDTDNRYQTIRELLSDFKNIGSTEYESQSFGSSKISKKRYPRWQFFALGAFILLVASIFYFTNPFGSDPRRIKSIAVLPFENYTGSDELEYFVAGMHSSLIGDIGKISALRVISKTTSNAYKNVEKSISDIASELRVDAVIEASVLGLGDSVLIQVKLVSAFPEEQQLWVQDYYEEKSQILNLYNRVTKEISKEINILLTPREESLLAESRTVDPEAYDAYMKGQYYWGRLSKEGLQKAMDYFNIAIEKDPDWAPPYAGLAEVWIGRMQMHIAVPSIAIPKIYEYINKALDLDPNSANSHYVNALIAVWTEWNWEKGEREFLKVLEFNPNDAMCRIYYAHLLMILLRSDEALYQANLALELDPLRPLVLGLYSAVMKYTGDFQSAITHAEKALAIDPDNRFAKGQLAGSYKRSGDYERWFEIWKKRAWWDDEIIVSIEKVFHEHGYIAAIEEMIKVNEEVEKKGGRISEMTLAHRYFAVKKYDKAMDYLEKVYEIHDPNMPYISLYDYDQLKDNPRYIALLKKMKLPLY